MTRGLTASMTTQISATNVDSNTLSTPTDVLRIEDAISWTSGTSINQSDRIYHTSGTLSTSGTLAIDCSGSLTDRVGNTFICVEITGIYVSNRNTVAGGNIEVGAGSNPLLGWVKATGDAVVVLPQGHFSIGTGIDPGYAVTAGTGDILTLTNTSGSVTVDYYVVITGRSA